MNCMCYYIGIVGFVFVIDIYIEWGIDVVKMSFGFVFYVKYFIMVEGIECICFIGCLIEFFEVVDGLDIGLLGVVIFEEVNY